MKKCPVHLLISLLLLSVIGCTQNKEITSPPGYDFSKPVIFRMPGELEEISGITFRNLKPDTVFAEQDEEGKIFYFRLGDEQMLHSKVAKKGDYEDIAACNNYLIMLRSDGVLFAMPAGELYSKESAGVQEQKDLLPPGEYEAMYADETTRLLYVLCKQCSVDKKTGAVSGYTLQLGDDGTLVQKDRFSIDAKAITDLTNSKQAFKPSAISKNPLTGEWYVLSSVNRLLMVTDAAWKPLNAYRLDASLFTQPEGMVFDKSANLYISNERGAGSTGTILKFNRSGGK